MWASILLSASPRKRLGLIVNPVAGIGGRVGLKGSDGLEIQRRALQAGAVLSAGDRAAAALKVLAPLSSSFDLLTPPGEMGTSVAVSSGFQPIEIGQITPKATTADDTIRAARCMLESGVDLILFAGGDGTARDMVKAVGLEVPVLGIPAGVKIHSPVFTINPLSAGELAVLFLSGKNVPQHTAEVVDLNEDDYRSGRVSTRLYGYLKIPYRRRLVQNQKAPTPASELARAAGIAAEVVEEMHPEDLYILGPGTTLQEIARSLGFEKTLVGVDVATRQGVIAVDVGEAELLKLCTSRLVKIVVTPIGGQGFLFGRGNQQISPLILRQVGRENILVVSMAEKLNALRGRPLLVDTGDSETDSLLTGYLPVVTGYHEKTIYKVSTSLG